MKNNVTKGTVFNFLTGNYTTIQRKSIEQWLEDPANEELFYQFLDEFEREHPQYPVDVEKSLEVLKSGTGEFKIRERPDEPEGKSKKNGFFLISAAAAVLIMSIAAWTYFRNQAGTSSRELTSAVPQPDMTERVNNGKTMMTVILPDKSSVILQPEARVSYSEGSFYKQKREVFFEGEGFFEILKDVNSPFIVYTNDYTTRVLGTSFTLKTSKGEGDNEVIVKTGKVAVYKREKEGSASIEGLKPTILLSANQRIKFDRKSPVPLSPASITRADLVEKIQKMSFEFNDTPVSEVFDLLSETYHVQISYNQEMLADCKITALLADEPLYEKIRLICFALDARFEMEGNRITILASGC